VVKGLIGGGPFTYAGGHHGAVAATNRPAAVQQPRPRGFVGGKGDRLLRLAAGPAGGWDKGWGGTTGADRERLRVVAEACAAVGRDPATLWRTLGLYALCGEDERDLARRFERLRDVSPKGVLDGMELDDFRKGRLVGTVDEVREQIAGWE